MTTYGINDNRKLTQDGNISDGIKPRIYFRERPVFELTSEGIHAGDSLRLAVDVDKDFLATAPMAVATGEGEEGSATFALNCATSRFEEVINGRACLVCAYIQLTRWSGGNCEVLVDDRCYVGSLVSVAGDDVEILPKPVTIPVPDAGDAGKVIGVDDNGNYALQEGGGGSARQATDAEIDEREAQDSYITPYRINYAVTAALTDAKKIQLTDAQKASAQDTLGAYGTLHLDAAPTTSTVGAFGQRGIVDSTGKAYTCTAVNVDETDPENPVTTYTWTEDAMLDANGKVLSENIPTAGFYMLGGVAMDGSAWGAFSMDGNILIPRDVSEAIINARTTNFYARKIVQLGKLDYAVRSVLPNITEIPAATSAYTLVAQDATTNNHCYCYEHAPESAPTYTLPDVSGNAVKREIILTVRFSSSVLTYAFEDSQGNALAPLFTPTISAGDVYEFDCEYSAAKAQWLIWPHKQGAVSDDYVMQSEVGAANGVAGLDEDGYIPRANLRKAGNNTSSLGVIWTTGTSGLAIDSTGRLETITATTAEITSRSGNHKVIAPTNLNTAVTAALTDSNKIQLTDAQKASAQDTLGAYGTLHLDAAPTTSTVGAFGQRGIVDATGKEYTCTAVTVDETDPENPVTSYTWQEDLPVGSVTKLGIVRAGREYGINSDNNGMLKINAATDTYIDSRTTLTLPIVPNHLDYAVRSVLPNITEIPAATSAYTLIAQDATTNNHCYCYEHAPESAPTYTLPAVTGNAVKREIILTVRFSSSVLTYAFEDSAGNPITPLPLAGTIADGSVVAFRCTWEALLGQWVIMPVMLGTYSA